MSVHHLHLAKRSSKAPPPVDDVARLAESMRQRVDAARHDTASSLLAARAAIDAVARAAESHVRELHTALGGLAGASSSSGAIDQAVARLEAVVTGYVDIVSKESEVQRTLAATAVARCDEIMAALQAIEKVAFAAKLLSLNAIVKAEAVTDGAAMSVLAMNMASLTDQLSKLNRQVAALGRVLVETLPAIADHARAIREETMDFVASFRAGIAVVGPRALTVRRAVDSVVSSGERRLGVILAETDKAHRALGFEGRFVETLDEVERRVGELERVAIALSVKAAPISTQRLTDHQTRERAKEEA